MDLKITGAKLSGDAEKDVKILANHVFQLEEQLRYQLRNLDVTNFNDLGLARYENGRMQLYAKQVEIQTEKLRVEFGEETDDIYAEISATAEELLAEIESVDGSYSKLSQTVSGIETTVKSHTGTINGHTNSITRHENRLNGQDTKFTTIESSIKQTSDKIEAVVSAVDDSNGNVTAASIVAAINKAGSTVKISADHVDISGFVTFSDLSTPGATTISGANIETGTINAGTISGGTLSGVRIESVGSVASWDDPLSQNYQTVVLEDGVLDITGTRMYDAGWNGFAIDTNRSILSIRLRDGTDFQFSPSGIFMNGTRIAG